MSRFLVRIGTLFVLSCLVIVLVNCKAKPAPGGPCSTPGKLYNCTDPTTALFCETGTFKPFPCKGPKGCTGTVMNVSCDDDLAALGDPCMTTVNENHACAIDHKSALVCHDNKWALWRACKGPKSCSLTGNTVNCDNSIGDVGDPCGTSGTYSCSTDHKMELICQSEKLAAANSCRGPKECRLLADNKIHCDESVAAEGDPCDTNDEVTCSVDKKSEVICKQNHFVIKQACKRKDGCDIINNQLRCDY